VAHSAHQCAECWSPIQESPDGLDASFHPRVPAGLQSLVPPRPQLVHHQRQRSPLKSLSQHGRHTHFCTMARSNHINTSTRLARPAIVRKAEPYPLAISIVENTTPQAERDFARRHSNSAHSTFRTTIMPPAIAAQPSGCTSCGMPAAFSALSALSAL
jgi:hypothetical protein